MSSAPLSSAFLAMSWGSQSCLVSAPWAGEACGVHLSEIWPPVSRCEPCHGMRSMCARGRARAARGLGLRPWPARPVVGHAAQACSALWPSRSRSSVRCAHGTSLVSAQKSFKNKQFLCYFSFNFKLNSNFKILYLNMQSSKNYKISSVGFIIF
jgi:hypothetical protein